MKNEKIIEALFLKGKVFTFEMKIWSGKTHINWKDIGINGDAITNEKLVTAGSKYLIDPDKINKLNGFRAKAYGIIRDNSFSFSFGSFVPEERVNHVTKMFENLSEEFYQEIQKIKDGYQEERAKMISSWNKEAKNLAEKKDSPEMVFEIMGKIEKSFPMNLEDRFHFEWKMHSDINEIAKAFIIQSTESVSEQIIEFVEKLTESFKEKDELHGKMIQSMHAKLENLKQSISFLGNDTLTTKIKALDNIVLLGKEIAGDAGLKKVLGESLDKIKLDIEENIESIKKESVKSIVTYSRNIEMD